MCRLRHLVASLVLLCATVTAPAAAQGLATSISGGSAAAPLSRLVTLRGELADTYLDPVPIEVCEQAVEAELAYIQRLLTARKRSSEILNVLS
ncbi:MAG: hypothetical protein H0W11_05945 [Gemmatimonadetes bacterium]|nr:hypothetical protein [Gemmatimonadota bacterium]